MSRRRFVELFLVVVIVGGGAYCITRISQQLAADVALEAAYEACSDCGLPQNTVDTIVLSLADSDQTRNDLEAFLCEAFDGDETRLERCQPCMDAIVQAAGVGD